MDQPDIRKRSTAPIWIIAAIVIILGCCCLVAGGGAFFYLYSRGQSVPDLSPLLPQHTPGNALPTPEANVPETTPQPGIAGTGEPQGVGPDQLIAVTRSGIWVVDVSTREKAQLSHDRLDAPTNLQEGLSPDKNIFAYVTGFEGASLNPMLVVLDIENQTTILSLELTGPFSQPDIESTVGDPALEATRAMVSGGSLAWSPDGRYLAFISAQDGDNADVYLFDREGASVTRLSDEPGHASGLHWSPDGQYIEYISVNSFGTGAGMDMEGLWVYDLSGRQSRQLEEGKSSGEEFFGWVDKHTFLIHSWGALCEAYNLRAVDVTGAGQDVLVGGCFTGAALNPRKHAGMLSVTEFNQENCNCGNPLEAGLYTFGVGGPLRKVESGDVYSIGFVPQGGLFTIFGEGGLQSVYDENGRPVTIPPEVAGLKPYPAPQGDYWAWAPYYPGKIGLWITGGDEPVNLSPLSASEPVWSQDGQTIYFIENNRLFLATAPKFLGELLLEAPGEEITAVIR